MCVSELRPLRKKALNGMPYTRRKETEETLLELLSLTDDALLARCAISSSEIVGYVPSECLVYLVRTNHGATERTRGLIFEKLAERILRRLPRRTASHEDSATVSLTGSNIADRVFDLVVTVLKKDHQNYDERLDICEICFDKMLMRRRFDARRHVQRRQCSALEIDDSTGEVSEELQKCGGSVQTNSLRDIERNVQRLDLDEAIDQLPDLQRQILHLHYRRNYPMHSEDPKTQCISKILKKSDKTVRIHHQQAIATLQSILNGEKKP